MRRMATLIKWDVIIFIAFGLVNFSFQLNFNDNSKSATWPEAAPGHSSLTNRRIEKSFANPLAPQIRLTINTFIVATCTSAGIFPDPSNEANYYICLGDATLGFIKYDFTCPPLEYFDSVNMQCLPSAFTATTTVSPPTSPPLQCISPGIFPMPGNCKMYYRCSTTLKMFNFTCTGASYFNEQTLKCSLIITPTCAAEILKNSTTTAMPTTPTTTPALSTTTPVPTTTPSTTASTAPTTSLSPTTTAASTTTTAVSSTTAPTAETATAASSTTFPMPETTTALISTTAPTVATILAFSTSTLTSPPTTTIAATSTTTSTTPFPCLMSGTFPDPASCKSYLRCSSTNVPSKYFCPGASYFNELTHKCSLTITPRCRLLLSK